MDSASVKGKDKTRPSEATEDTKNTKTSSEESETMYQFQGQYARSQHWFYLDTECTKDNFMTI